MGMKAFVHEQLPVRILFGRGRFNCLDQEVERLGASRVLLVSNAAAGWVADRATQRLEGRVVKRIRRVRQHVPVADVEEAAAMVRAAGVDCLVSTGGGSATGLAKAVGLQTGLPILAVPTTYAGSEMTSIYGISEGGSKRTGRDIRALPKTVVYDPELTISLPGGPTASTGMNALAHCVEALYARDPNPIVELLAEDALGVLARALPRSVEAPSDLEARGDALYGALLAGLALASAGMALHHAISHVLGGSYGLRHGDVNSALLPHVVRFNEPAAPEAVARVARALGVEDAAGGLYDLASSMGAPTNLRELGMSKGELSEAAHWSAQSVTWNPRAVGDEDVLGILSAALEGARP
jgi:maleylacetate reductase